MKGIPKLIQTRADLQNLFAMYNAKQFDENEVATFTMRVRALYATQYHKVPILDIQGALITTYYFPEAKKGGITEDEHTIKDVEHVADPDSEPGATQYTESRITLSKAPHKDVKVLSLYMEDNHLVHHGFDIAELKYILGVLKNAKIDD